MPTRFYEQERVAVFIDGSNLYSATRSLALDIDYSRLLLWLQNCGRLVRASYYTAIKDDGEVSALRPLVDWLDYNGFHLVKKATKSFIDADGREKIKGNMDIEMAVDMLEAAENVDHILLFSGDGDFRRVVEAVQRKGVRVTVVSTMKTKPVMVADELRRQSDNFLDVEELRGEIAKKVKIVEEANGNA